MKFKRLIYLLICVIISAAAFGTADSYAAKKKNKAKTTQSSKSSSRKSRSKKSGTSRSKKHKSSKKSKNKKNRGKKSRYSSKTKKRRNAAKTTYKEAPKEIAQNDSLTLAVNSALLARIPAHLNPGGLRVNSVKADRSQKYARVSLNENFTYMPISREFIDTLTRMTRQSLPDSISDYRISLNVGNKSLAYYIHKVDKLPEKYRHNPGFVEEVHPVVTATRGMDNDIIALWHSHGRYYKNGSWQWQRPVLFETIEDIYYGLYIALRCTDVRECRCIRNASARARHKQV